MNLADILPDLGRPLVVYPSLARLFGLKSAAFLCNLFWWTGKQRDPEGWIYKTIAEIEAETGLTRTEQATAVSDLKRHGVLEDVYHRLEHRKLYRVKPDALAKLWSEAPKTSNTESSEPAAPKAGTQQPRKQEPRFRIDEASTPTSTPTSTPIGNSGKAARPNWAGDQFPKVALLCPTMDTAPACKMLNMLAKAHGGRTVVEEALERLNGQTFTEPEKLWAAMRARCRTVLAERAGPSKTSVSEMFKDPSLEPRNG